QVLADQDAGRGRPYGAELATDLGGGVRLEVERVEVAHAAPAIQDNARAGLTAGCRGRCRGPETPQAKVVGQRQPEGPEAEPEQGAPAGSNRVGHIKSP